MRDPRAGTRSRSGAPGSGVLPVEVRLEIVEEGTVLVEETLCARHAGCAGTGGVLGDEPLDVPVEVQTSGRCCIFSGGEDIGLEP